MKDGTQRQNREIGGHGETGTEKRRIERRQRGETKRQMSAEPCRHLLCGMCTSPTMAAFTGPASACKHMLHA